MASEFSSRYGVVTLESVSEKIDYGLTTSATLSDTGIKFLRITDIQDNGVNWRGVPYCECSERDLIQYSVDQGDIVFARTGATTGKSFLIREKLEKTVFASYLIRVRANPSLVDPEFLSYFFQTEQYWQQISESAVGAAQVGVNGSKLAELRLPLPPLTEQKRIASLLRRADRLHQLRRTAHELGDTLLQSMFLEMFGDPEINPKNWDYEVVDELCELVRGSSPRPQGDPRYFGGPVLRLMVADITRDGMYVTPQIDSLTEAGAKQSRPMTAGDVVMVVSGIVGLPAILSIDACIHDGFVGFRNLDKRVYSTYFYFLLLFMQQQNSKQAAGAIWQNLTTDQIRNWRIPLPPLGLQEQFASVVARVEGLRARMSEAERQAEELFQGLLVGAFE